MALEKCKKILITGGAGFMGSNFIRYLLAKYKDYQIVNLDKLTYAGNLDNLVDLAQNQRYKFVKGDITDEKIVDRLIKREKIDVICNFAAESHVDRSILGPREFVTTDVIGVLNLLEAGREHQIKRFIQISTDEVYGAVESGTTYESAPFRPRSPYAASKAGGDHLVLAYYHTYNLPVVRVHSCNFYGPYQYPEKFIPLFITNFLEGKSVPLYGAGTQVREWIFTQDFCRALDLVMHKGSDGEVYNIGTGYRRTNIEVAKALAKLSCVSENLITKVTDRPGHDVRYALNAVKIKKLGFKPKYSFLDGLRETVKWYQNNQKWWRKIKNKQEFREYYRKQYKVTTKDKLIAKIS